MTPARDPKRCFKVQNWSTRIDPGYSSYPTKYGLTIFYGDPFHAPGHFWDFPIRLDWIHKEPCLTAPQPRTCGPAHGPGPMSWPTCSWLRRCQAWLLVDPIQSNWKIPKMSRCMKWVAIKDGEPILCGVRAIPRIYPCRPVLNLKTPFGVSRRGHIPRIWDAGIATESRACVMRLWVFEGVAVTMELSERGVSPCGLSYPWARWDGGLARFQNCSGCGVIRPPAISVIMS